MVSCVISGREGLEGPEGSIRCPHLEGTNHEQQETVVPVSRSKDFSSTNDKSSDRKPCPFCFSGHRINNNNNNVPLRWVWFGRTWTEIAGKMVERISRQPRQPLSELGEAHRVKDRDRPIPFWMSCRLAVINCLRD